MTDYWNEFQKAADSASKMLRDAAENMSRSSWKEEARNRLLREGICAWLTEAVQTGNYELLPGETEGILILDNVTGCDFGFFSVELRFYGDNNKPIMVRASIRNWKNGRQGKLRFPMPRDSYKTVTLNYDSASFSGVVEQEKYPKILNRTKTYTVNRPVKETKPVRFKPKEAVRKEEPLSEKEKYLSVIYEWKSKTTDPDLLARQERLEYLTIRLFNGMEERGKTREVERFAEFYFPKMIQAIETYNDLAGRDVPGAEMTALKDQLSAFLDQFNLACEKTLSKLYMGDVVDVSTDLSAMERALSSEGLIKESKQ